MTAKARSQDFGKQVEDISRNAKVIGWQLAMREVLTEAIKLKSMGRIDEYEANDISDITKAADARRDKILSEAI